MEKLTSSYIYRERIKDIIGLCTELDVGLTAQPTTFNHNKFLKFTVQDFPTGEKNFPCDMYYRNGQAIKTKRNLS